MNSPGVDMAKQAVGMAKWLSMLYSFGGFVLFYFGFAYSAEDKVGAAAILCGLGVILFISGFHSMYSEHFTKKSGVVKNGRSNSN
jgi:hypothetical protein